MDQTILNWLFAGGGAAIGWILKIVWDAIKDLKLDMKQIERDLPEVYQRKDDFKATMAEVKSDYKDLKTDMKDGFAAVNNALHSISVKLERKEDRS